MDAATIVGLLADRARPAVFSALVLGAPDLPASTEEVDATLRALAEQADHATLRRYLVDHGLLARERGRYWRSGGRIDVLG